MSQIAALLAPTVLPRVAGMLVHAEAAAAQGANFADLLTQFRTELVAQIANGETPLAALLAQSQAQPTAQPNPDVPADIVQATPPVQALSPLDILNLSPSRQKTESGSVGEGGPAVLPPELALLQLLFPAASAAPLHAPPPNAPSETAPLSAPATAAQNAASVTALLNAPPAAAPRVPVDATALSLRGAILPEQVFASTAPAVEQSQPQSEAPIQSPTTPQTQTALARASQALPQSLDGIAMAASPKPATSPIPTDKTVDEAIERAAASLLQPAAAPQAKAAEAPQAPNVLKPAARKSSDRPATVAAAQTQSQPLEANKAAGQTVDPAPSDQAQAGGANAHGQQPSTPPGHKDAGAANTPTPAVALAHIQASPALITAQAVEAAVANGPQAGVPLDALAVNIARKFQEGSSQFELRLHPMELGRLDISLTVAEDGRIQAVLRAERPETLDMLQKDARVLEQQLRQAGLEVGSNALSFSLSNGNGQRQAPFTGWPAFADAQNVAGAAKEEAASTYIAVRERDGLDIRV